MANFPLNKKTIGAFFAGIATCFTLISTLTMSPGDMRRWILNDSTNEEKVERALVPQSITIIKLKEEVSRLNSDLVGKVEEFNSSNKVYRDENKKYRKSIEELRAALSNSDKSSKSLEDSLSKQASQNELLKKEIETLKFKNKEVLERIERSGLEKNSDYSLILKEQVFYKDAPRIYFGGKLTITASSTFSNRVFLEISQFFPEKKEMGIWLEKGKPELIEIVGIKYIIHLLEGSSTTKSIISTFYASN